MENNGKDGKDPRRDIFKKIVVIKNGDEQKVLLDGRTYMSWRDKDRVAQRVAVAQLFKSDLATKEELAEAFGINVKSVYNYTNRFEKDGIAGLLDQQSGPKDSWKITPEVRFMILEVAFRDIDNSYEGIADIVKKRWNNLDYSYHLQKYNEKGLAF